MPLTIEDVQKKMFTPVRLREGYDTGEVDQFLDEVEEELTRLHQAIDELQVGRNDPAPTDEAASADVQTDAGAAEIVSAAPASLSVQETSSAAARLLELATNSADQLVAEARVHADSLLTEARGNAERLESETRTKAEELESVARQRQERFESETQERREHMLSDLERDKSSLSQELEELRSFEREYRARLKAYFEAQLQALEASRDDAVPASDTDLGDGGGTEGGAAEGSAAEGSAADGSAAEAPLTPSADEGVPRRLRELLGEDA